MLHLDIDALLTDGAPGSGLLRTILCLMFSILSFLIFDAACAGAHSADEVKQVFDRGPIPKELLEATKELDATAGQKSIREEAHAKQHILLEQYIRAGTERKCTEAIADITRFDEAIVDFRDKGNSDEENKLRQVRDDTATFITAECADTSVKKFQAPQP